MTVPLIPELNASEQMIAQELLWVFLETPWRNWTCCDGVKRPYIWQFLKRRAYKAAVEAAKSRMEEQTEDCDYQDVFLFAQSVPVVHAVKYRKDFCKTMVAQYPLRRMLFNGNDMVRGGMIAFHAAA